MFKVSNPVPRIRHPDWLHKKILEKSDVFKQRRITDMFSVSAKPSAVRGSSSNENIVVDIEESATNRSPTFRKPMVTVNKRKRGSDKEEFQEEDLNKTWREVLGNPPPMGDTKVW